MRPALLPLALPLILTACLDDTCPRRPPASARIAAPIAVEPVAPPSCSPAFPAPCNEACASGDLPACHVVVSTADDPLAALRTACGKKNEAETCKAYEDAVIAVAKLQCAFDSKGGIDDCLAAGIAAAKGCHDGFAADCELRESLASIAEVRACKQGTHAECERACALGDRKACWTRFNAVAWVELPRDYPKALSIAAFLCDEGDADGCARAAAMIHLMHYKDNAPRRDEVEYLMRACRADDAHQDACAEVARTSAKEPNVTPAERVEAIRKLCRVYENEWCGTLRDLGETP